jgi:outer membrane protein assembly factor BamB
MGSCATIDENKDGHIDRNEWAKVLEFTKKQVEHGVLAIKSSAKGDARKTHVSWQEKKGIPEVPSPLYYRQRLYLVRDGGVVSCLQNVEKSRTAKSCSTIQGLCRRGPK